MTDFLSHLICSDLVVRDKWLIDTIVYILLKTDGNLVFQLASNNLQSYEFPNTGVDKILL